MRIETTAADYLPIVLVIGFVVIILFGEFIVTVLNAFYYTRQKQRDERDCRNEVYRRRAQHKRKLAEHAERTRTS